MFALERADRQSIDHAVIVGAVPAVDAPSEFARRKAFLIDLAAPQQLEWFILTRNHWIVLYPESVKDIHLDSYPIGQHQSVFAGHSFQGNCVLLVNQLAVEGLSV